MEFLKNKNESINKMLKSAVQQNNVNTVKMLLLKYPNLNFDNETIIELNYSVDTGKVFEDKLRILSFLLKFKNFRVDNISCFLLTKILSEGKNDVFELILKTKNAKKYFLKENSKTYQVSGAYDLILQSLDIFTAAAGHENNAKIIQELINFGCDPSVLDNSAILSASFKNIKSTTRVLFKNKMVREKLQKTNLKKYNQILLLVNTDKISNF